MLAAQESPNLQHPNNLRQGIISTPPLDTDQATLDFMAQVHLMTLQLAAASSRRIVTAKKAAVQAVS
jgi:hypothetical protein